MEKQSLWNIERLKREQKKGKKIAIYCAGLYGQLFSYILGKCGMELDAFLDTDSKKWNCKIDSMVFCENPHCIRNKEIYIVLICINKIHYEDVYQYVHSIGFRNIANFNHILDDIILNSASLKYVDLIKLCSKMRVADLYYTLSNRDYVFKSEKNCRSEKIAVYTGIFGNYDSIMKPKIFPDNIDYYFISDYKPVGITGFRWIDARTVIPSDIASPIKRNRYIKMHPHLIFPEYKYSIYLDGNISVEKDISFFIGGSRTGISAFLHPKRDCIFYEAFSVSNFQRIVAEEVCRQMERYLSEGMPLHYGMPEMAVIAREHKNPLCIKIMEEWWNEFNFGAQRDQLSFMYIIWKNGLGLSDISLLGDNFRLCDKIKVKKHDCESRWISNTI